MYYRFFGILNIIIDFIIFRYYTIYTIYIYSMYNIHINIENFLITFLKLFFTQFDVIAKQHKFYLEN